MKVLSVIIGLEMAVAPCEGTMEATGVLATQALVTAAVKVTKAALLREVEGLHSTDRHTAEGEWTAVWMLSNL